MKKIKKPSFDKPTTIIGEDTEISVALLKSNEPIKILGRFNGDIESHSSIVIAGPGYVKGNVKADFAYVCGVVEGDMDIMQTVQISHNGNVTGNIVCSNIITDEGAILNGSCTMRVPQIEIIEKPAAGKKSHKNKSIDKK